MRNSIKDSVPAANRRWFQRLVGEWRITRRISRLAGDESSVDDGQARIEGRLRGTVSIQREDDDTLLYSEAGTLTLRNGTTVNAVRRYRYKLDDDALLIEFADGPDSGRRFIRLDTGLHAPDDGDAENAIGGLLNEDADGAPEKTGKAALRASMSAAAAVTADVSSPMESDHAGPAAHAGGRSGRDVWSAEDDHLCGRDLYQALYRFKGFGGDAVRRTLVQRTIVSGPRKDYAIISVLQRNDSDTTAK
jgi:hypothetical protein